MWGESLMIDRSRTLAGSTSSPSCRDTGAASEAGSTDPVALPISCAGSDGRVRPLSIEAQQQRNDSAIQALDVVEEIVDETDSDEVWREVFRDIDASRPHRKLFEWMY